MAPKSISRAAALRAAPRLRSAAKTAIQQAEERLGTRRVRRPKLVAGEPPPDAPPVILWDDPVGSADNGSKA